MTGICTVIDDDPAILDAVSKLLHANQVPTAAYTDAQKFLDAPLVAGCVLTDVRMPTVTGLQLLDSLLARSDPRPVILMTGQGDISMAVRAVRIGAFDFIEKPFENARLVESICSALEKAETSHTNHAQLEDLKARFSNLTDRQKRVMALLVLGHSNKEIATRLMVSHRTVENYRAWTMQKMEAKSLADLVRIAARIEDVIRIWRQPSEDA